MAITVKVHGVEVVCGTPEEAAAVATASTKIDVPSKEKIADRIKGPFKVNIGGVEVICDTAEAAAYTAAAAAGAPIKRKRTMTEEAKGKQGEGPRRSWQEAEDYAKKHNITTDEARRILAKKKKELMAKAVLAATGKRK